MDREYIERINCSFVYNEFQLQAAFGYKMSSILIYILHSACCHPLTTNRQTGEGTKVFQTPTNTIPILVSPLFDFVPYFFEVEGNRP